LVKNAPKLKIAAKNRRSIITTLKAEAVHIQAKMHPYRPKIGLKISFNSPFKNMSTSQIYRRFFDSVHVVHSTFSAEM
jgi:hypothetical protein